MMKINLQLFIFITLPIHTMIYCSKDPAYMYVLWSRALMSAPNTICDLIRGRNKLAPFIGNDEPTVFIG